MLQAGFGGNVLGGLGQLAVAQRAQQVAREDDALAAQFGQALLNLLKNAHEACAEADPPNDDVQVQLTRLPQWLRLDVLDRGKGMNEQVLQNALMPFYSTKRNGTGLGLALTREIEIGRAHV